MKTNTNMEKVFYAIAQLINDGDTHITRYKIAKNVPDLDRSTVYRLLDRYTKLKELL